MKEAFQYYFCERLKYRVYQVKTDEELTVLIVLIQEKSRNQRVTQLPK